MEGEQLEQQQADEWLEERRREQGGKFTEDHFLVMEKKNKILFRRIRKKDMKPSDIKLGADKRRNACSNGCSTVHLVQRNLCQTTNGFLEFFENHSKKMIPCPCFVRVHVQN